MPCRAESVGAVILPKAHSEEGCLESLKLQSLVVTRVFLLWIRVCSRDCRERRRSERRRKEGGREERGEEKSPLTFCTNFTPLSRCYRRRRRTRRARTTPSSTQLFTARKNCPLRRWLARATARTWLRDGRQSGKCRTANDDFPNEVKSRMNMMDMSGQGKTFCIAFEDVPHFKEVCLARSPVAADMSGKKRKGLKASLSSPLR